MGPKSSWIARRTSDRSPLSLARSRRRARAPGARARRFLRRARGLRLLARYTQYRTDLHLSAFSFFSFFSRRIPTKQLCTVPSVFTLYLPRRAPGHPRPIHDNAQVSAEVRARCRAEPPQPLWRLLSGNFLQVKKFCREENRDIDKFCKKHGGWPSTGKFCDACIAYSEDDARSEVTVPDGLKNRSY